MMKFLSFIFASVVLGHQIFHVSSLSEAEKVSEPIRPPLPTAKCPNNLAKTCQLQCVNGNYMRDENGCPICACASDQSSKRTGRPNKCPLIICGANCSSDGYKVDENGCRTCECVSKSGNVRCSPVMCRISCAHGLRRDENGCEICKCNDTPQPCPKLKCPSKCPNGYQKDYSGCATCACNEEGPKDLIGINCTPMKCGLKCPFGFERDPSGCEMCSCNRCPPFTCSWGCTYGFKKNSEGCDICECDHSPTSEKIQCNERVPCEGLRACNLDLKLCEKVSEDKVKYFLYNFNLTNHIFANEKVREIFTRDLINNIASEYDLQSTQIAISSVKSEGMTFQIMPLYADDPDEFQRKMDQIDLDLNSHEFRSVLPNVTGVFERPTNKSNSRFVLYLTAALLGLVVLVFAGIFLITLCRRTKYPKHSDSKSLTNGAPYQPAPTEDDHYHAVHAPDGTAYVVVKTDDIQSSDK